jgi:hypothetical protein
MSKITKIVAAAAVLGIVGMTALPIASYAVGESDDTAATVTVEVSEGMSLACVTNYSAVYGVAADVDDTSLTYNSNLNGATLDHPANCVVISNNASGYDLTVMGTGGTTTLTNGAQTLATVTTPAGGTAPGWAIDYATSKGGSLSGTTKTIKASAETIASPTAATANTGDLYAYGFKTAIAATTAPGTYTGGVTFTATGK